MTCEKSRPSSLCILMSSLYRPMGDEPVARPSTASGFVFSVSANILAAVFDISS